MLTPENIRDKKFEKAVFGGYDMATVDAFLDEIATDMQLLAKENATLKGKMKVLVGKIEEYRSNEDALRAAMISAQRLGTMIELEARERSEKLTAEANKEAERLLSEARLALDVERSRLAEARAVSARYIESMEQLCAHQTETLRRLRTVSFMSAEPEAESAAPAAAPQSAENANNADNYEKEAVDNPTRPFTPVSAPEGDNLFTLYNN